MIKLNEDLGTSLRRYVEKNSLTHESLIGKRVMTEDGEIWFINSIDAIADNTKLPYQIFCGKRPGSEFGHYINTNKLFIADDIDLGMRAQVQVQPQAQVQPEVQVQESDQTIAREILNQLGNNKFIAMTGAKQFISDDNSLRFSIPRAKDGINRIKITLNSLDLYDVEYGKQFADKYTVVKKEEGIYNDMLVPSFERNTGLYTKLF
jgi:hypothetical protein